MAKKVTSEACGQMPWASHHYEWAEHCRKLADPLGQAAHEAQSLAKIHERIAVVRKIEKEGTQRTGNYHVGPVVDSQEHSR